MMGSKKPSKIYEKVFMVAGPDMTSPQDCCVYLIDCGGELALIDTGCGPAYKSLIANIIRLGFEPDDVSTIILTHCHIDHVGAAARLRAELGAEIVVHAADSEVLSSGDRLKTAAFLYEVKFDPLTPDRVITGHAMTLKVGGFEIRILHTPGHTPGSISAFADIGRARILFGQDIHGPFHPEFGSNIEQWRHSMERLLELEADILCEGHFGVYSPRDAVSGYILRYLEHFSD